MNFVKIPKAFGLQQNFSYLLFHHPFILMQRYIDMNDIVLLNGLIKFKLDFIIIENSLCYIVSKINNWIKLFYFDEYILDIENLILNDNLNVIYFITIYH